MTDSLVIVVPTCPPIEASPNHRSVPIGRDAAGTMRYRAVGWREKAAAVAAYRETTAWAAIEAASHIRWVNGGVIFDGPVAAEVVIGWGEGQGMKDPTNAAACLKPAWDGLQDARIVTNDRQIADPTVQQEIAGDRAGWTRIVIRGEGAG